MNHWQSKEFAQRVLDDTLRIRSYRPPFTDQDKAFLQAMESLCMVYLLTEEPPKKEHTP